MCGRIVRRALDNFAAMVHSYSATEAVADPGRGVPMPYVLNMRLVLRQLNITPREVGYIHLVFSLQYIAQPMHYRLNSLHTNMYISFNLHTYMYVLHTQHVATYSSVPADSPSTNMTAPDLLSSTSTSFPSHVTVPYQDTHVHMTM